MTKKEEKEGLDKLELAVGEALALTLKANEAYELAYKALHKAKTYKIYSQ
jgi:hypothetical protein